MIPSTGSRLRAAATAFVLGFVVANVGILVVAGPDRWWWVAAAAVLMTTGAVGVLVADSERPFSLWGVLGLELFAFFTLFPLAWTLSLALRPEDAPTDTAWPVDVSWAAFGDVLDAGVLRTSALTSVGAASAATAVAMLLAVPAAYALARRPRGSRAVEVLVVAALLAPLVALAGPWAGTANDLDLLGSRWTVAPLLLLVALPLATWLCIPVLRDAPWSLRDAIRSDGADRRQVLRSFAVPLLLPELAIVAALVWVVTSHDVVLGAALGPTDASRTLPASLLLGSGDVPTTAAAGLLWLVPVLVLLAVAPRRVHRLIGRCPR